MTDDATGSGETTAAEGMREVRYRSSEHFAEALRRAGGALLVSTYQAGKLVVIGLHRGEVAIALTNFEQAMGVAVRGDEIVVGGRGKFWSLQRAPGVGPQIAPAGRYDQLYAARGCQVSGPIDGHEMVWIDGELWIANTLFSCLCTLTPEYSFQPRWRPPFVSQLAAEDRCHLNGVASDGAAVRYVTTLGETDAKEDWRANKAAGGCLIDVSASRVVARGLCMPHSPRLIGDRLWVLNSGRGEVAAVDAAAGEVTPVVQLPGYTRGFAANGPLGFVGLSKIRETSTFGGLPIAESDQELVCGVGVVDLQSGRQVAAFQFLSGVDEIFDVQLLPGVRFPAVHGPFAQDEGTPAVWVVPQ